MDVIRDDDQERAIKDRIIAIGRELIACPTISGLDMLLPFITAHRARDGSYRSDGNRELSGIGRTALTSCIRFGRYEDEFKGKLSGAFLLSSFSLTVDRPSCRVGETVDS